MKKALTTLIVVAALVAGSFSFAGSGPRTGGYRTTTTDFCAEFGTTLESCLDSYGQQY
jgi:hypothetical protein